MVQLFAKLNVARFITWQRQNLNKK